MGAVKRAVAWLLALGGLTAVAAGLAGYWGWRQLHTPYGPEAEVAFVVEPGETARGILERLAARGLLPDATLARIYLIYALDAPTLQAGEYAIPSPATTPEILALLVRGEVVLHQATVIEGLTLEETAESLVQQEFGTYERFLEAMRDPSPIADLDPEAETLEGYLFPDTYSFPRGASEDEIVATMVATFRSNLERLTPDIVRPADMDAEAAARGEPSTSLRELVILASIVEKEALLDSERPTIAGVYRNRLDRGIGLYADPTIIFALKQLGTWDGNIRRADLALDSPYNTYVYPGLPPGPICSPGLASLEAALRPAEVPYLYFVSRNDGTHVFARTLREHNRNVDQWQRRYWRERRANGGR